MAEQSVEDGTIYRVVVNHEEQYSIWPADREFPLGWRDAGKTGPKADCLAYIEEVWTDMRPLSLRKQMETAGGGETPDSVSSAPPATDPRDNIVDFLCEGDHPVQVRADSVGQFLDRFNAGYVNLKFTDTRGGTELGVKLDRAASNTAGADIAKQSGKVQIAGDLTLNYRPVRLTAEVTLETLEGSGRLRPIPVNG
ncbi:MAG TPA: MbtH family NRPS accessory protein [Bryobacteraceae bacterium]